MSYPAKLQEVITLNISYINWQLRTSIPTENTIIKKLGYDVSTGTKRLFLEVAQGQTLIKIYLSVDPDGLHKPPVRDSFPGNNGEYDSVLIINTPINNREMHHITSAITNYLTSIGKQLKPIDFGTLFDIDDVEELTAYLADHDQIPITTETGQFIALILA
jgi:hypothetical protein